MVGELQEYNQTKLPAIYGGDCEASYFARIRRLQARQAYYSDYPATSQ